MSSRNSLGTVPFLLSACLFLASITTSQASPIHHLAKRGPNITYDASGHITNITDSATMQQIMQGDATDGSGVGMNIPAIVWLAWALVVGVPLMLGGIRLGRLTTGAAIGIAGTLCSMCFGSDDPLCHLCSHNA
jgi:hypothetical protein